VRRRARARSGGLCGSGAAAAAILAGLAASALLTACSLAAPGQQASGSGSSVTSGTAGTSAAAGHDAAWVADENAKPGTPGWTVADPAGDTELAGYFGQVSVLAGEDATLYATSTLGDYTLTAYRLGWYGGTGARAVWTSPTPVRGVPQPRAEVAADRTVTTRWQPSATVPTTGWPEGSYLVVLRAPGSGKASYVPLVVRTGELRDRLVLDSANLSYQAYNQWGGHSLYKGPTGAFATRSHRVSFDRPYDRGGAMEHFKFEVPIVQRAERVAAEAGLNLGYTTAWDLDRRPGILAGARGLVTMGHDEYWTVPERDAVEQARDAGTNLAFLGANAAYWRVRLTDGTTGAGRTMVGYKDAGLDPVQGPATTALWRGAPAPKPENSLTGMLYECFPARGPLVVRDASFFAFAAAKATDGATYPGLVGTEIDRAYPIAGTPKNVQVVAHSPVPCATKGQTYGDTTYYTATSGAGVFASGTMLWTAALAGTTTGTGMTDRSVTFARDVTDALLREMAKGPLGRDHPATGNLAGLGASTSTEHGTGGPIGSGLVVTDDD
jgi:hypothetical protein